MFLALSFGLVFLLTVLQLNACVKLPGGSDFVLDLDLAHPVRPDQCTTKILSTKVSVMALLGLSTVVNSFSCGKDPDRARDRIILLLYDCTLPCCMERIRTVCTNIQNFKLH